MSVTGWVINAKSFIDDDYGFVNIATTWKGKDMPSKPKENEPIELCGLTKAYMVS